MKLLFDLSADDYRILSATPEGRAFVQTAWRYWIHDALPQKKNEYLSKLAQEVEVQQCVEHAHRVAKRKLAKEEADAMRRAEHERQLTHSRALLAKWPHGRVPCKASWRKQK